MKKFVILVSLLLSACNKANSSIDVIYERPKESNEIITGIQFRYKVGNEKKITKYRPDGDKEGAADMGSLYYKEVISPDGEWVFLPRGRFEGFVFTETANIGPLLDRGKGTIFFIPPLPEEPRMVYQFIGWENNNSVKMEFGIGGEMQAIIINLQDKSIVHNGTSIEDSRMKFIDQDEMNPKANQ